MKPKSVIVLTNGLAGSSVLAGLLCRSGYWPGEDTWKKEDYDTFENQELVALNRRIFEETGYDGNYTMVFSREAIDRIAAKAPDLDPAPYEAFVRKCAAHRPWIWKDPRLWLTIRFWERFLDLEDVRFVVLSRDPLQSWISTTLRRQIQTWSYARSYGRNVFDSIVEFLDEHSLPRLPLLFEDLLCKPEETIERLNAFLGCALTLDDLKAVYTKPLYRRPRGIRDLLKASLIYLKNYRERYR